MATDHDMRIGAGDGVRGRALSAASHLLMEYGADEMSLRGIAERAGIGLASIYHHFSSKEDLLLHLALKGFSELRRDLEISRTAQADVGPMRRAARAYLTFADKRAPLFALMFDPRLLSRHETLREAERSAYAVYEAAVQDDTRIDADHRAQTATAIWTLGRGISASNASYPGGRMPDDMQERLAQGIAWLLDR
ncbi:TetR/AcrR family transcriptional regulator [Oceanicola sp. 22II-s10i]|uniref:TetR/AcrR family transcriptional regulator n=1 Tax=Oceanicola sp. 22II-s10i TaxID=1317116 RepID=UPI000B51E84F|nr:TetR/AcrR family transcriptional regulator [Oceanicola sp. 22II-s10i]